MVKTKKIHESSMVGDFLIPSQIKQKLFLMVVKCVGDCYCYCYRHGIFQNILYINIQYKYNTCMSQTMTRVNRGPHTKYA